MELEIQNSFRKHVDANTVVRKAVTEIDSSAKNPSAVNASRPKYNNQELILEKHAEINISLNFAVNIYRVYSQNHRTNTVPVNAVCQMH